MTMVNSKANMKNLRKNLYQCNKQTWFLSWKQTANQVEANLPVVQAL